MKNTITIFFLICLSLNAQIAQEWVQRYNGVENGTDQAISIALDEAANIFVSGVSTGSGTLADIVTIKYNPVSGDTLWVNRYAGVLNDQVNAMIYSNNAVYVTGWSFNPGRDIITIKYDAATGNRLWVKTYNGSGNGGDYGFAIAVDPAGNVYVTGRSDVGGAQKFTSLKYDSMGNMAAGWPSVYTAGLSTVFDEAHAVKVDAFGNVFVTGRSGPAAAIDYLTIKINSSGIVQWAQKYNGNMNSEDNPVALVIDNASSNVFVAGYSIRTGSSYDYFLIKYAASNGDSLTSAIYNGPVNIHDVLTTMTIDNFDNVYVTGMSWGSAGGYDFATIKYNSMCEQQWVGRYNGPGNYTDKPNSITVDALGNVYVTGYSFGTGSNDDYATVMYNSSGVEKWLQRYEGPGNGIDAANSLAVDGSGNVYVTGWSAGISSGTYDYATIKYRQLPDAPSGLGAAADFSRKIQLSWNDNANNENGFKIEKSVNGGTNWNLLVTLPANTVSFLDTGLTINSIYHYRVFSFNSFGSSAYSNVAFDTAMSNNPVDNINLLISMVNNLNYSGILNQGQTNSLIVKLNSAKSKIQEGKFNTAINQLGAFINQVNGFINGRILTIQQGQPLINLANSIIEVLRESDKTVAINSTETPAEFSLHNNYPNPFNPVTKIKFDIANTGNAIIIIYDMLGKEVKVLLNSKLEPGTYETSFNASNYPSGVYFYRLVTDFYTNTKKMIFVK